MFNNENEFKNLIDKLSIDDKPSSLHKETVRAKMLDIFNAARQKESKINPQTFWRTIMKSSITKLATAAMVMIAIAGIIYQCISQWSSTRLGRRSNVPCT